MADTDKLIKEGLAKGTLVVGEKLVVRSAKKGEIEMVITPSNVPVSSRENLEYFRKFGLEVKKFEGNSRQLGQSIGKPFTVNMLGIRRKSDDGKA